MLVSLNEIHFGMISDSRKLIQSRKQHYNELLSREKSRLVSCNQNMEMRRKQNVKVTECVEQAQFIATKQQNIVFFEVDYFEFAKNYKIETSII